MPTVYIKQRQNKKIWRKGDSKYICWNKLNKACFKHDTAYRDFRDLPKMTASDKVLRDKAVDFDKTLKCRLYFWTPRHGYQRGLVSIVYKFFDKNFALIADKSTAGGTVYSKDISN